MNTNGRADGDLVASHVFAKHLCILCGAACKQCVWLHYFCTCKVFGKHVDLVYCPGLHGFKVVVRAFVCIAVVVILCIPA